MALSSNQKRKARQLIATQRGVAAADVPDSIISNALASGLIDMADLGGTGGYTGGDAGYCAPADTGYTASTDSGYCNG